MIADVIMNCESAYPKCFRTAGSSLCSTVYKLLVFLMVSSLATGISGFFMTFMGYILLGISPNISICFAVFLASFSVYSLNKLTDMDEDAINMPERLSFLKGRRMLVLYYSLAAYILSAVIILLENPLIFPVILVPLVANAIYSSKIIPGLPRLKDIPVMKNVTVATSWALVTTLPPAMCVIDIPGVLISGAVPTVQTYAIDMVAFVLYFMLVKDFINTVLYDIRDVEGDKETGVRTMPVLLGTRKTTIILLVMNSTLLFLLTFVEADIRLLMAALILYGYVYILYFRKRRSPLQLDFFVDGEWMLASILFLLWF